jgi:hypothetical protein
MHAARKILSQNRVNHSVLLNTRFASKGSCLHGNLEMCATAFAPAGMTSMLIADILNVNFVWLQSLYKLSGYGVCRCHMLSPKRFLLPAGGTDLY